MGAAVKRIHCLAAFTVLYLSTIPARLAQTQDAFRTITGELLRLTTHVPAPLDGDTFLLQYQAGDQEMISQLMFKSKPAYLASGDQISVQVRAPSVQMQAFSETPRATPGDPGNLLMVDSYQVVQENPKKDFTYYGGTQNISSITWITKICGVMSYPGGDVAGFKSRWVNQFNAKAGTINTTMQNYYKECSYGKMRFAGDTNIVVDLTKIDLGCTGTWQFQYWSAKECGIKELFGWLTAVQKYTKNVLGIDYTKYSRWVLVIPDGTCPWGGQGNTGCGKNCVTFFKGSLFAKQLATAFHELGHNLGLNHATTPGQEYGDGSSTMGGCCGDRCFNAAQAWQLNWATPIAVLNATTSAAGVWYTYPLPVMAANTTNHVQVVPTWLNGMTNPAFFFSFRNPYEWDANLLPQYLGGVSVHIFNGSQQYGPWRSELQGVLSKGSWYNRTDLNFVVQLAAVSANSATIKFCRLSQVKETSCTDGLDNDCNGLTDAQDPNCRGKVPPSSGNVCIVNGVCNRPRENYWNCPQDCPPVCGDKICTGKESAANCPADCPPVCGDCFCDVKRGESAVACPHDCPPVCGDGFCDLARGENAANCPDTRANGIPIKGDCPARCGDGICDAKRAPWENVNNCPLDCNPWCGDGFCSRNQGENSMSCAKDCKVTCGDRFCDTLHGETRATCPRDCPAVLSPPGRPPPPRAQPPKPSPPPCSVNASALSPPPPFPPGTVLPRPAIKSAPPPTKLPARPPPSGRRALGQSLDVTTALTSVAGVDVAARHMQALSDPLLQPVCGDGKCHHSESAQSCPVDCPAVCGDGFCDKSRSETTLTCAQDCPREVCGDGVCGVSETEDSCASDCCPAVSCGDGVCQMYAGENCLTCPEDCYMSQQDQLCCGAFLSCAPAQCNSNGFQCSTGCTVATEEAHHHHDDQD